MALSTISDALAMKFYLGHKRKNDEVATITRINEQNAKDQYGHALCLIKIKQKHKPKQVT